MTANRTRTYALIALVAALVALGGIWMIIQGTADGGTGTTEPSAPGAPTATPVPTPVPSALILIVTPSPEPTASPSPSPAPATASPAPATASPAPATASPGPTPEPTPRPSGAIEEPSGLMPTLPPTPVPSYATFEDGTKVVGAGVKPGTYRTREAAAFCLWFRLAGFEGKDSQLIGQGGGPGYAVVTIGKKDVGFRSTGCGTWTKDLSAVTETKTQFGEGTFIVGTDMRPGTYSAKGTVCTWSRLANFGGKKSAIISNGVSSRRVTVRIASTDKGFTSTGCGTWVRQ